MFKDKADSLNQHKRGLNCVSHLQTYSILKQQVGQDTHRERERQKIFLIWSYVDEYSTIMLTWNTALVMTEHACSQSSTGSFKLSLDLYFCMKLLIGIPLDQMILIAALSLTERFKFSVCLTPQLHFHSQHVKISIWRNINQRWKILT